MPKLDTIQREFENATHRASRGYSAIMGDEDGTVRVSGKSNQVYIQIQEGSRRRTVKARNGGDGYPGVPEIAGTEIRYFQTASGEYLVIGLDANRSAETTKGQPLGNVGPHAHGFNSGMLDMIDSLRFLPGLVHINTAGADMSVEVQPFLWQWEGARGRFAGGTKDLTPAQPASGEHCWVLTYWDPDTEGLAIAAGTATDILTPLDEDDIPDISATGIWLGVYQLRGDDSAVNDPNRFAEGRFLLSSRAGGIINAELPDPLALQASSLLTISSGAITVTKTYHTIAAESGTTDDLDTITAAESRQLLVIQADSGDTITVKHGTGNINLNGAADFTLTDSDALLLFWDGTQWVDTGAGGGAGGGANTALSNLASVAVNTDVISDTDDTDDLGSSTKRWAQIWGVDVMADAFAFPVTNNAGAAASAGDVGLLQYDSTDGYEYVTTTTAEDGGNWCAVVVGGADGATIYVAKRGQITLNYAGDAPSAGDYLTTSTTAGSCVARSTPHYNMMAVALAAGAGGTVAAQLLTQSILVNAISSESIFSPDAASDTAFVAKINGAPVGAAVVYDTVTGNEDSIKPSEGTQLGKLVLHNTTRGDSALIDDVNTGTNTITLTDNAPGAWANNDDIQVNSLVSDTGGSPYNFDVDLSSDENTDIPTLARALLVQWTYRDTGGANELGTLHPYETWDGSQAQQLRTQVANIGSNRTVVLPLIQQRFEVRWNASGSGTVNSFTLKLFGYWAASP